MIDDLLLYLSSKKAAEEWTSLEELSEIIKKHGIHPKDTEEVLSFLKKYFLEVDENRQKARLNSWAHNLFEIRT